ncbi:MAG: cytochrome b N-terminal domain-containing protein [Candidatus Obscuribacterales bacterium]|nr:cytochrome b N-terminal domain-containing protein [Candidatus Obscuribacterales bacterium]
MPSSANAASSKETFAGALNKATDWLNTRIKNIDIFDEHFHVEAKTNPFYSLGGIFYLVWFVVMLTGCVLIMWYIPTKAGAFDSILRIQHDIPLGNLWRGMHKYGADAMIIAATLRLYRMFLCADYKPGREFNIAIALVTLLLSMYSGLTGYLLIWNQRAFWATKVFATFPTYMDQFPIMGDFYLPLVKSVHLGWNTAEFLLGAGGAITQETITRFFSLHLAFSAIPLMFVELYFYKTGYKRIPLDWTKRLIVIAMLVIVAVIMPAALGHRSNPDVTPLPILSDWYFLGLYQMYKYLEPVVATEITMVIPLSVVLLPFIDVWATGPEKDIKKRPMVFYISLMGFWCWVIFSLLIIANIANIHNDPPYWRDFLYLMIDIGVALQLWSYIKNHKTVQEKAQAVKGCIAMGAVMIVQTFWAVVYYYMALTEMFFSPLSQAFAYWLCRPFMSKADETEALVRKAMAANPNYWDYHNMAFDAGAPGAELIKQIDQVTKSSPTMIDGLFQIIPSFTVYVDKAGIPHPIVYQGTVDYLISNRWCFDYLTFCDRMTPNVVKAVSGEFYPLSVPTLDWGWMVGGAVTAVACFIVMNKMKAAPAEPAKTAAPATTASASS